MGSLGGGCDWTEYRYDWADRLVEVRASAWANGQGSGTGPARIEVHAYQSDALGRRIAKTLFADGSVAPGTGLPPPRCTRFIHGGVGSAGDASVGWQVLEEQDGTGRTLATFVPSGRYVDETVCFQRDFAGSGLLENQAISTTPEPVCGPPASAAGVALAEFWLHADEQFSTTSVTDSTGAVVERYDYHDYGFPLILDADGAPIGANAQGLYASKVGNPRLFTGREWDAESKLYHYRTRAYHPGLGRFLQIDRIGVWGDAAQLGNAFGALAANPLRWLDPMGLCADPYHGLPQDDIDDLGDPLSKKPENLEDSFDPDKMDDFFRKFDDDMSRKYRESGLETGVKIGVLLLVSFTPLDETAIVGYAAAKGLTILRNAAGRIIGLVRAGNTGNSVVTRFVAGAKIKGSKGEIIEGTVDLGPTLDRIDNGIPHPHVRDGTTFRNDVPKGAEAPSLPVQPPGHYKEYVVPTPGMPAGRAGEQRIVRGADGKMFYTPDHYKTFIPIN